jgi:predicted amidohydrolase YtcJ
MAAADVVITGTVLTVDDARPAAEALAVVDFTGPNTRTVDVGDGCVMPGFVEGHGHPLLEAMALPDRIVDIGPVTVLRATFLAGRQVHQR